VATYNNNVLVMSLYVDGQLAATGNPAAGVWAPNEVDNAGAPTTPAGDQAIGSTSDNDPQGTNVDSFYGGIDDVAIYNYALTAAQITSHYTIAASPTLVINKGTGDSIVVTWSSGHLLTATNLLGPWTTNTTATPPLTNTITGSTMFFKAVAP
jgi:hypothetical protein